MCIKNLKNGKAGLDGIGTRILKACSPVLSIYLAQIFNQSLNIGYVPKCWKIKRVSPIHKGDEKTDPNNFSHISIFLSKNINCSNVNFSCVVN